MINAITAQGTIATHAIIDYRKAGLPGSTVELIKNAVPFVMWLNSKSDDDLEFVSIKYIRK